MNIRNLILIGYFATPMTAFGFDKIDEGETVFVSCENSSIYEEPTVFSKRIVPLSFGDRLTVLSLHQEFRLPSTDFSSEQNLQSRENQDAEREGRNARKIDRKQFTRAAWFGTNRGFIAASCAVSERTFTTQKKELVLEKIDQIASSSAKRNFSEDESGDMTAMRGAAGKARGGRADYDAIDELIEQMGNQFDRSEHRAFREEGELGEFK